MLMLMFACETHRHFTEGTSCEKCTAGEPSFLESRLRTVNDDLYHAQVELAYLRAALPTPAERDILGVVSLGIPASMRSAYARWLARVDEAMACRGDHE